MYIIYLKEDFMGNYKQIKLEKGMYQTGKGFLQTLEKLDPTESYKGTNLEKLDAFERQLCRYDIRVSGEGVSTVGAFFENTQTAVLFPEYVKRAVVAGLKQAGQLHKIVAATTVIEGTDYRPLTVKVAEEDRMTEEGNALPESSIVSQKSLVNLKKQGRLLSTSYEAIRFQRLEVFTAMLRQIGASIARSQMTEAVRVLIEGDGNNNAAEILNVANSELTYADLLSLWGSFENCEMNTMVSGNTGILKMAALNEFQNPLTGINFAGEGTLRTPIGAELVKSSKVPEGMIIGLDKTCALEKVCAGQDGVLVDFDKLIDHQLERATITSITGFSKIFPDAVKVLQLS